MQSTIKIDIKRHKNKDEGNKQKKKKNNQKQCLS